MSESSKNWFLKNFNLLCRLCLSQNTDILNIFNRDSGDNTSLKNRIKECVTIEVSDRRLP